MRAGRDPTRRNRKIGRPDHGVKLDQPFQVPWPGSESRPPEERFSSEAVANAFELHGRTVTVLVEPLRERSIHPCSIEDVITVLGRLPQADVDGIGLVVLRQPTRKEELFQGAWGRLNFDVEWRTYRGPAIVLEAVDLAKPVLRWGKRLSPVEQDELELLRRDGFEVRATRRGYEIQLDPAPVRTCQLYRTVPHEVGHWVDWKSRVLDPAARADDFDAVYEARWKLWQSRPPGERETFASRYAEAARPKLLAQRSKQ